MKSMPWFRLYSEFIHDPKMRRMPIAHRYAFIVLLCLASEATVRGVISGLEDDDFAYELEVEVEDWLSLKAKFRVKGLIEIGEGNAVFISNWDERQFESDSSTERSRKHREKKKESQYLQKEETCNVAGTLQEREVLLQQRRSMYTDTDPDTDPDPDPDPDPEKDPKDLTLVQDEPERVSDSGKKASRAKKPIAEIDTEFETFWTAYPRKEAKQDALKAFKSLIGKKVTPNSISKLLEERKRFQWLERDKQYIPLPASFLRGESFAEEIEADPSIEISLKQQMVAKALNDKRSEIEQMQREIEAELALEASHDAN
jgi:hypothetical protein